MAYMSVPARKGSIFQRDPSTHRLFLQKLAEKTEEFNNRNTREGRIDDAIHVKINVGGKIFVTRKSTLRNVPSTLLANLTEQDDNYNNESEEYYFDRNPVLFQYILDYYRTGSMHLPKNMCATFIKDELRHWGLSDGCISECCRKSYFDELDYYTTYELIKSEFYSLPSESSDEVDKEKTAVESRFQIFKRNAWEFIDSHESSLSAKIFAVFYYGLVILSILSLFFSTLLNIRVPLKGHIFIRSFTRPPDTTNMSHEVTDSMKSMLSTDPPDFIVVLDLLCLLFFSTEFLFRLVVCPSIQSMFRSWYTLLDLVYLIPAWIRFFIDIGSPFYWQKNMDTITLSVVLDALMVLRVLRIFRLSRHYRGLRVFLLAIKASVGELMLLIVFILFSLTMFACVSYYAEQISGKDTFSNIFFALWWALITMTTVGYGDFYPSSTFGYIVGSFCSISGLLIIGMVVPIIAGNFILYYGFRYAGCDDVELTKPEFIPSVNENPFPSSTQFETYKKKTKRVASNQSLLSAQGSLRPPTRPGKVSVKQGSSLLFSDDSITSVTNGKGSVKPGDMTPRTYTITDESGEIRNTSVRVDS